MSYDLFDPKNSQAFTSRVEMSEISKDIGTIIDPEQSFEEQAKNLTSITQEAQRAAVDLNFEQDFQDKAIQDEL